MNLEKEFSTVIKPMTVSLEKLNLNKLNYVNFHRILEIDKQNESPQKSPMKKESVIYTCSYQGCNKYFGRRSRLIVHERTHTGERPFMCEYENCSKSYTRKFHLTRHIALSHKCSSNTTTNDSFKCDLCEKIYSNTYSLKKHHLEIHRDKRYLCTECGQAFRKQQHLKTHSYQHTGIKPYRCEYPGCESSFLIPSKLKRHSLSHECGRYSCTYEECTAKFDSYTALRHHLASNHIKTCDACGKEFNTLSRLRTHLATHEEIREAFFCPFTPCERYYYEKKNLHAHICSQHNQNFKGFECPICSKWLVTKQKLKQHLTTHDLNKAAKKKSTVSRKARKDKGVSRTDYAKLLSGYDSDDDDDGGGEIFLLEEPLLKKEDVVLSETHCHNSHTI